MHLCPQTLKRPLGPLFVYVSFIKSGNSPQAAFAKMSALMQQQGTDGRRIMALSQMSEPLPATAENLGEVFTAENHADAEYHVQEEPLGELTATLLELGPVIDG